MPLVLTAKHRRELVAGQLPNIGGEGPAPTEKGEQVEVATDLELTVATVHTSRTHWWIDYRLHDGRFEFRNLQRTPANGTDYPKIREAFDPANFRYDEVPNIGERDDGTGMGSAYTAGQIGLVDDAGEAPDAEWMRGEVSRVHAQNTQDRAAKKFKKGDELSLRLERAQQLIAEFDPGDDPVQQKRKRKAVRALTEKEAA